MNRYLGGNMSAVLWREWLGLICAFLWFFGSMVSYYEPFFEGTLTEFLFMLLLCMGLIVSALLFGRHPSGRVWGILPAATFAGAVCTGLIPFLPIYAAKGLFWLSALLMTPLLCRRLYGTLRCAKESIRSRVYISAVAATIVLQMVWALLPLPFAAKFPLLSLFALLGLWRAESRLPAHERAPLPQPATARTPVKLMRIAAVFLLLVGLNIFNTQIHTHVLNGSLGENDLLSLLAWLVVPPSFLFFAVLSDRGRERLGFTVALTLILLGCFSALTPDGSVFAAPLLLSGEFGGTITEFCFLTMPLLFFPFSKRPVLIAVSGLIAHTLFSSAVSWTQDLWLPQSFLSAEISRPLIIFGAVCAAALIPLSFSVWRRQEDAILMAALLGLKKRQEKETAIAPAPAAPAPAPHEDWAQPLDLLEDEHRIATLLCDGLTRTEIAERLELSPAKVAAHLKAIRAKLDSKGPLGFSPEVVRLAGQYGLTGREAEVLNELMLGRSNTEIAANLHIEETTVKTHVGRVLKKVGAGNRSELISVLRG